MLGIRKTIKIRLMLFFAFLFLSMELLRRVICASWSPHKYNDKLLACLLFTTLRFGLFAESFVRILYSKSQLNNVLTPS